MYQKYAQFGAFLEHEVLSNGLSTKCIGDMDKINLVKVVWFQARDNFHYCFLRLKNFRSNEKSSRDAITCQVSPCYLSTY